MPLGNLNENGIVSALCIVVFPQLLPQPMGLDANNGIGFGVEILGLAESSHADGVFLKRLGVGAVCLGHQELKQLLQSMRIAEGGGAQNPLHLALALLLLQVCHHYSSALRHDLFANSKDASKGLGFTKQSTLPLRGRPAGPSADCGLIDSTPEMGQPIGALKRVKSISGPRYVGPSGFANRVTKGLTRLKRSLFEGAAAEQQRCLSPVLDCFRFW